VGVTEGKGVDGDALGEGVGAGDSDGDEDGPVGTGEAVGVPKVGLGVGALDLVGEVDGEGLGAGDSVGFTEGRGTVGAADGEGDGAGLSVGVEDGIGLAVGPVVGAIVGLGVGGAVACAVRRVSGAFSPFCPFLDCSDRRKLLAVAPSKNKACKTNRASKTAEYFILVLVVRRKM